MGIPNDNEVRLSTRASKWIWLGLAVVVVIAGVLIYLAVAGGDDDEENGEGGSAEAGITVLDPWVRAPMPGMAAAEVTTAEGEAGGEMAANTMVTAAYMSIANDSDEDDRLLSATADVAGRVEIHETTIENDVAQMRPVSAGLIIPAGQTVDLAPSGVHLMLLDLNTQLTPGMVVSLTLNFSSGAEITVQAPVQAPEE